MNEKMNERMNEKMNECIKEGVKERMSLIFWVKRRRGRRELERKRVGGEGRNERVKFVVDFLPPLVLFPQLFHLLPHLFPHLSPSTSFLTLFLPQFVCLNGRRRVESVWGVGKERDLGGKRQQTFPSLLF